MSKTDIQSGMIIMSKAYLVVRISGTADVPYWATTTMNLLKLEKKHRAVIIPEKDNTIGMLRKIQLALRSRTLRTLDPFRHRQNTLQAYPRSHHRIPNLSECYARCPHKFATWSLVPVFERWCSSFRHIQFCIRDLTFE